LGWPGPHPGRLLEPRREAGPRGMAATGRKVGTEPGLTATSVFFSTRRCAVGRVQGLRLVSLCL